MYTYIWTPLVISMPGPLELLLILLVVLLLFGAKRLPELAKGLGEGLREFKNAITGESKQKEDETPPK